MELNGQAVLIRIYIGETDRWHHQPLSTALVERLRREGFAGATVLRGLEGFGARSVLHTTKVLRLSQDLPLVVEIVESEANVARMQPILEEMVTEGLITTETVRVLKHAAGKRPLDP